MTDNGETQQAPEMTPGEFYTTVRAGGKIEGMGEAIQLLCNDCGHGSVVVQVKAFPKKCPALKLHIRLDDLLMEFECQTTKK